MADAFDTDIAISEVREFRNNLLLRAVRSVQIFRLGGTQVFIVEISILLSGSESASLSVL